MGESEELPFLLPASEQAASGRAREHDLGRREAQIIVVGFLVANLISIMVLLAMRSMLDTAVEPTMQFLVGVGALMVVGAASEVVRWRVRRRSGLPVRSRSPRDDLRFLRDSADACGWPKAAVEVVLLVSWLVVMALVVAILVPAFLGSGD